MLRNHVSFNIGSIGQFVNSAVSLAAVVLAGGAYFAAIGRLIIA